MKTEHQTYMYIDIKFAPGLTFKSAGLTFCVTKFKQFCKVFIWNAHVIITPATVEFR